MVVQVAFNTLIPFYVKLLIAPREVESAMKNVKQSDVQKRRAEYEKIDNDIMTACEIHKDRCRTEKISEDMIQLRSVFEQFHNNSEIRKALEILYIISVPARTVFSVMLPRIVSSLKTDNKIESSGDVPMELMKLWFF